ncbi:MAG: FkbM family methyltransferase [Elusimicrobia bacterium]|nr:FkbM family methyltransferase [Elusimicrobiota bacterium]
MGIVKKIIKAIVLSICDPKQFFKRVISRIMPSPKSPVRKKINGVLFNFDFNIDPVIKRMYYGIYEVETVRIMRKFLSKGDTFIDVGANIGYISAVALGIVGETGCVHSFEPVPEYYGKLNDIALANKEYKIMTNQYALSDRKGMANINITNISDIGWNTMVPCGFISKETIRETIEVPTYRLDDYIKEKALDNISLIKIDTEGFEFPVLKGLSRYFETTGSRPVIICEIAPIAYPLLGYTLGQLSEYMKKYGYHTFDMVGKNTAELPEYLRKHDYCIFNKNIEIDITQLKETTDVLFIAKK